MTRFQLIIIFLFILGFGVRLWYYYHNTSKYNNGQQVVFSTTLLTEPTIIGNKQQFSAFLDGKQKISVVVPLFPELHYGQTVRISGTLQIKVLQNKRVAMAIYFPNIEANRNEQYSLLAYTSIIRQKVVSLLQKTLPSPASSLLLGIVFGIKEGMPQDFFASLRAVGVLHVIAASGMNVTLVGGFLSRFWMLFFRRQVGLALAIVGIIFYSIFSGLEPSIIRAAIMGILVFSAQILGRQYTAGYGLFVAAYSMLFLNPQLFFDVGFQLSFTATLGLIFLRPLVDQWLTTKKTLSAIISDDLATTLVAQIATLPILLANFGTYSPISIVVNGLVLWTIPPLMIIGSLGVLGGFLFDAIGRIILYFSLPLLLYFSVVVQFFAGIKTVITFPAFPWQFSVAYYLFLVAGVLWLQSRSNKHL